VGDATETAVARRHLITLMVIAGVQLMVVLDATIVNVALPTIQEHLHFSATGLSWVLNAYTLTFGGLLLLGGRAGDILGRRRMLMVGIAVFAGASFAGGLAESSAWLLACRALQGVGGAIASPTALALITTNFEEGHERNRAFGVFAAVSGAGAAVGLLAGGMLTSWLSWRWVFFVNVPVAIVLIALTPGFIAESQRVRGKFDLPGAITSTLGMSALVYGFIRASDHGWSNSGTLASFAAAVVLLTAFVMIELRTAQPLTPLHMFASRNRSGSYVVMLALSAALFGTFFFLTLFVQEILHFSPLRTGFAFLPTSLMIGVTAQIASRRLLTDGPKKLMSIGAVFTVIGLGWQSTLSASSTYWPDLVLPMLVFAAGMGLMFVPLTVTAISGVQANESGAASSLLNVMQQVGASLGLSILVTVFGTASRNEATAQAKQIMISGTPAEKLGVLHHMLPPAAQATVLAHGISRGFAMGLIFAIVSLVVALVVVKSEPVVVPEGVPLPL
jgi:EmrB/QacA subfamily drug resistance transporter